MDKREKAKKLLEEIAEDMDCCISGYCECSKCGFGIGEYDYLDMNYDYRCALQIVISAL